MCTGSSSSMPGTHRDPLVAVPQHCDDSPWHLAGQEVIEPVAHDIDNVHIQKGVQANGVFQPIDELLALSPIANLRIKGAVSAKQEPAQELLRLCTVANIQDGYKQWVSSKASRGATARPSW